MSGPKRGYWRIRYDPTPTRLDDLSGFAAKQSAWLARNGSFIERFLGSEALAAARAAYDRVQQCIENGDPDGGFDWYGQAWATFNELHRNAVEARQQAQLQQQRQEQQRRLAQQQAAAEALRECREAWQDAENQALLARWTDATDRERLAAALDAATVGSPEQVQAKARAWQSDFGSALAIANGRAARNAQAIQRCRPGLSAARQALDSLNVSVLPDSEQGVFGRLKSKLQARVEDALSAENLRAVRSSIEQMQELTAQYQPRIRAAELEKASHIWRGALARCGYSVVSRKGPDGSIILQASSFPMKSLNVEVRPDTEEVRLDVNGKHDHTQCVKDVQSLQAELARQGVQLTMTDWGRGKPGAVERKLANSISTGGAS
jgi:hypothetical protein